MGLIDQAEYELERARFGEQGKQVMRRILALFFHAWPDGHAISIAAPALQALIAGRPLTPLTGQDDEWIVHGADDEVHAQNRRCGTVFKRKDGTCYDAASGAPVNIKFPYQPGPAFVPFPIFDSDGVPQEFRTNGRG